MTIQLINPIEENIVFEFLTVDKMVDIPSKKIVYVFIKELNKRVTLWENEEYDAIGQWTDVDVENRLLELFNI